MAWIIDKDYLYAGDSSFTNREGYGSGQEEIDQHVCARFRLFDDDGELYYSGRISLDQLDGDERDAFEPLDWARADAGCTRMDYLDPQTKKWRTL